MHEQQCRVEHDSERSYIMEGDNDTGYPVDWKLPEGVTCEHLSLIHISEPTRPY